jgi:hypothetical protein
MHIPFTPNPITDMCGAGLGLPEPFLGRPGHEHDDVGPPLHRQVPDTPFMPSSLFRQITPLRPFPAYRPHHVSLLAPSRHLGELKGLGVQVIDPIAKLLACGDLGTAHSPLSFCSSAFVHTQPRAGVGAMAEVPTIVQAVKERLASE